MNEAFVLNNNNENLDNSFITDQVDSILQSTVAYNFDFRCVSELEVIKATRSISTNAIGVDGFGSFILKMIVPFCATAIVNIINFSFYYMKFPSKWKLALIQPIPKKSNPELLTDYRLISLLPAISKIIERLVYYQVSEYLNSYNLLDPISLALDLITVLPQLY